MPPQRQRKERQANGGPDARPNEFGAQPMDLDSGPGVTGTEGARSRPRPAPDEAADAHTEPRHDDSPLSWRTSLFIAGVSGAGIGLIAWYAPRFDSSDALGLTLLTLLAVLAGRLGFTLYGETHLSVTFIPIFAVAVLYGPAGVAIAGPVAAAAVHIPRHLLSLRLLFDVGNITIAIILAAITFEAMAGLARDEIRPIMPAAALVAAAVAYVVNAYLVSQVASLTTGRSLVAVWLEKGRWLFPHYVVFGLLGLALALAYHALGVTGLLVFLGPPIMMRLAISQYVERTTNAAVALRRENQELKVAYDAIREMAQRPKDTPDSTVVSSGHRSKEMAWLAANRRDLEIEHPGQWIAVHGDEIVAVDEDLATVIRRAKAKGIGDPLLVATRFKDCQEAVQVGQWL